jgi:hypothetical protein
VPTQNAHGPDFYPRPNNSVRVRTAGAGPSRALAQLNPHALLRTQQPVACSSRPSIRVQPAGPGGYTQTPGATPRKVSRIPESGARVNEKPGRAKRSTRITPKPPHSHSIRIIRIPISRARRIFESTPGLTVNPCARPFRVFQRNGWDTNDIRV